MARAWRSLAQTTWLWYRLCVPPKKPNLVAYRRAEAWKAHLERLLGESHADLWRALAALATGRPIVPTMPDGRIGEPLVPKVGEVLEAQKTLLGYLYGLPVPQDRLAEAEKSKREAEELALSDEQLIEIVGEVIREKKSLPAPTTETAVQPKEEASNDGARGQDVRKTDVRRGSDAGNAQRSTDGDAPGAVERGGSPEASRWEDLFGRGAELEGSAEVRGEAGTGSAAGGPEDGADAP